MIKSDMNVNELYRNITDKFSLAGIESPDYEARILICEILSLSATDFYLNSHQEISDDKFEELNKLCQKRLSGEPIQYIIGKWDFMGRTFKVGPGVLIPRPETELLCEKVIERLKGKKEAVVFDLCSGSGCIGLTLKKECPDIDIYMVEKSPDAIRYIMENSKTICKNTFYTIIKGDVLQLELFELYPLADIIVSNPPYIKSDEVPHLQKEVTFEPEMALDGGSDGLYFYRYIIQNWSQKLKPDGEILFEIGEDQGDEVSQMFKEIGFNYQIIKDYNNHDRIVTGRKAPYVI